MTNNAPGRAFSISPRAPPTAPDRSPPSAADAVGPASLGCGASTGGWGPPVPTLGSLTSGRTQLVARVKHHPSAVIVRDPAGRPDGAAGVDAGDAPPPEPHDCEGPGAV